MTQIKNAIVCSEKTIYVKAFRGSSDSRHRNPYNKGQVEIQY